MDDPGIAFRARTHGAVESERMLLLKTLCRRWDVLEKHEMEGGSQKQKWDLWQNITKEFNSHPSVTIIRTPLQVKTLFKNMKTKAKKYQVRLEDSRITGRIVEADPVSEILIRILSAQTKGVTNPFVELIKQEPAFTDPFLDNPKAIGLDERLCITDQMVTSSENSATSIKEEAVDIEEDNLSNIDDDVNYATYELSEDITETPLDVTITEGVSPACVHTFGDISVTPLTGNKNNGKFNSDELSITSFAGSKFPEIIEPRTVEVDSDSSLDEAPQKRPISDSSHRLMKGVKHSKVSHNQVISANADITVQPMPALMGQSKFTGCCCPDYHNDMLHMAQKEHHFRLALLDEELTVKRAEHKIKEEEMLIRTKERMIKEEELESLRESRQAKHLEHRIKMKLLEIECEAVEARIRHSEKNNKWLFRNGSKEV